MRVVASVDIEGATGIVSKKETREGGIDYNLGKRYLTRDVNAAIEGALEAGATQVVCHDSHGLDCRNILLEDLNPAAEVVRGAPILFFEDLQPEYDACFIVAAHSSYSEERGVLNHLFSSQHFKDIKLNGQPICEAEHTAALAGYCGIPTVLITGDDITCGEMKKYIPDIETAVVKYAISRYAARCLPFSKTGPMIREAAKRALIKAKEGAIRPYTYEGKQDLEIRLNEPYRAKLIAELTEARMPTKDTVAYTARDAMEVYRLLRLVLFLSFSTILS